MKVFNLHDDEWHETRDRDGWRMREAFVGHHIGGELLGASMCEVEPERTRSPTGRTRRSAC